MATRGQFITEDHWPTTAGSLALVYVDRDRIRDGAVGGGVPGMGRQGMGAVATVEVFQESVRGGRVFWPRDTPSRRNCTPTTPTLSEAVALERDRAGHGGPVRRRGDRHGRRRRVGRQ